MGPNFIYKKEVYNYMNNTHEKEIKTSTYILNVLLSYTQM